jgi:hypothetical protein
MFWEVDESLMSLLRAEALRGTEAEVAFEAPTTRWASGLTGPVVDAFLYDVREDTEKRQPHVLTSRDDAGHTNGQRAGTRYFRMSYLLSAWTTQAADEHRLLGQLLENLIRFEVVPDEHLHGRLEGAVVPITTALPPREDRSLSDLWGALGGEMKPSLDVVVVVPLVPERDFVLGPPVQQRDLRVLRKSPKQHRG